MTKTFTTARPSFVRALATLKNLVLPKLDKQKLHMKIMNETLHRVHHLPIKCYTIQIVMVIMIFQKKFILIPIIKMHTIFVYLVVKLNCILAGQGFLVHSAPPKTLGWQRWLNCNNEIKSSDLFSYW